MKQRQEGCGDRREKCKAFLGAASTLPVLKFPTEAQHGERRG